MDFEGFLLSRQYAAETRRVYLIYANRFDQFTDPAVCTLDDLTEFLETIPNTAASQRQARKALVVYLKFLRREPNPAIRLHAAREPHRLPRPLTEDEHLRWIAAAHAMGGRHELAGTLLATTGCRQGELRQARWSDFTLIDPGTWRIRGKSARQSGPRWRHQPLHPVALQLLTMAPRHGEWLFPGSHGHMSDGQMRHLLVEIGEFGGLGRITPHRLRHSVATLALARSGNLRAVQTLMGHQSINSTVRYTEVLPGQLTDLVASLPV